jgi:hypothetical protein
MDTFLSSEERFVLGCSEVGEKPAKVFRGDDELPLGGFRGDEELPPGGFRA